MEAIFRPVGRGAIFLGGFNFSYGIGYENGLGYDEGHTVCARTGSGGGYAGGYGGLSGGGGGNGYAGGYSAHPAHRDDEGEGFGSGGGEGDPWLVGYGDGTITLNRRRAQKRENV